MSENPAPPSAGTPPEIISIIAELKEVEARLFKLVEELGKQDPQEINPTWIRAAREAFHHGFKAIGVSRLKRQPGTGPR